MKDYHHDKYENRDKSLSAGIAAFFSSFLFVGGSLLIYFLRLSTEESLIDALFLAIIAAIFFLAGVYLFIWGAVVIINNIISIKKKQQRPKKSDDIFINTHPIAGLLALILSIVFTFVIIFFLYPKFKEDADALNMLICFIIFAILLFIYAVFVFIANLIKKK